jgi:hypothetical protein
MKRKIIFSVIVLVIAGIFTIQSCKKASPLEPVEFIAALPAAPQPVNETIIPFTGSGQTVNLSWEGASSTATSWDVYFGKQSNPPKVATVTSNAYTANIGTTGGVFNWRVIGTDANGKTTESPVWSFDVNSNPNVPGMPVPALNAINVSCNPTIKWSDSDPEGDDLTYDLFLDTNATPAKVATSGISDTSVAIAATLVPNTIYYWQVVAHDPYGGQTAGPIWKFTTGALPASKFTGNYNADEPAEAYSYGVAFTLVDASHVQTNNYWNSGWTGVFTLDLTNGTYNMPLTNFGGGWTGKESGIIYTSNGKMVGTYVIWLNGVIQEEGVHTYTHL